MLPPRRSTHQRRSWRFNRRAKAMRWLSPPPPLVPDLPDQISEKPRLDQLQSPLFGKLPSEIRNRIFDLASTQTPIRAKAYHESEYYYRPGYTEPNKIHTAFLRTCRKVYLEAWWAPMSNAEFDFWYEWSIRCPPLAKDPELLDSVIAPSLVPFMSHVNIFGQSFWFENGGLEAFAPSRVKQLRPKILTLTVRHEDWYAWEQNEPLRTDRDWFEYYVCPSSVEELVLEFETLEEKKKQLESIIKDNIMNEKNKRMDCWKFKREDGVELLPVTAIIPSRRWTRNESIKDTSYHNEGQPMNYFIAEVRFKPEMVDRPQ